MARTLEEQSVLRRYFMKETKGFNSHKLARLTQNIQNILMISLSQTLLKKTYQNSKKQFGRTMLEMLGTLAIIGVLSIGAINGIRYVLDKNTANAIMKEALTQASEIKLRRRQKKDTSSGEIKYAYKSEYIRSRTYNSFGNEIILKTKNSIIILYVHRSYLR